jgi:Uma2 family endonuclease
MVSIVSQVDSPMQVLKGEQRVVFHGLDWQAYRQILTALPNRRSAKLLYDCGTLEITMPTEDHEFLGRMIGVFIRILVEELGHDLKTIGSTTIDYPALDRAAEADEAFYIQNQPQVAGRTVDFAQDPPPDLVLEVDITHTDIDKNRFYASLGVPELWRFNGRELQIYRLQNQQYIEVSTSPTFPTVDKSRLYQFLEQSRSSEVQAAKALRVWLQDQLSQDHNSQT